MFNEHESIVNSNIVPELNMERVESAFPVEFVVMEGEINDRRDGGKFKKGRDETRPRFEG